MPKIQFKIFLRCLILAAVFGGLLLACEKSQTIPAPPELPPDRTIRVTARHVYNLSPPMDSLLAGVKVLIYDDREYFKANILEEASRTTDSAGIALFEFRKEEFYWIRALHPELGEVFDSVSTPGSTVSFVDISFY